MKNTYNEGMRAALKYLKDSRRASQPNYSKVLDEAIEHLSRHVKSGTPAAQAASTLTKADVEKPVRLTYTNWRGEISERTLNPRYVWFGSTEWHHEPQWFLKAFDLEKSEDRDFALKDFGYPPEPCEYCGPGIQTGLPNNACENCMNTGLKNPAIVTVGRTQAKLRGTEE